LQNLRARVKHLLKMCGHAIVSTTHDRLDEIEKRLAELYSQNACLAETQEALLKAAIHLVETTSRNEGVLPAVRASCLSGCTQEFLTEDENLLNPEVELAKFLCATSLAPLLLQAEGSQADTAKVLVEAGCETAALETLEKSETRRPAAALFFSKEEAPSDFSLPSFVERMRQQGYCFHLTIFRENEQAEAAYYCNLTQTETPWRGAVFFFRSQENFLGAERWCAATLPRAVFRRRLSPPEQP